MVSGPPGWAPPRPVEAAIYLLEGGVEARRVLLVARPILQPANPRRDAAHAPRAAPAKPGVKGGAERSLPAGDTRLQRAIQRREERGGAPLLRVAVKADQAELDPPARLLSALLPRAQPHVSHVRRRRRLASCGRVDSNRLREGTLKGGISRHATPDCPRKRNAERDDDHVVVRVSRLAISKIRAGIVSTVQAVAVKLSPIMSTACGRFVAATACIAPATASWFAFVGSSLLVPPQSPTARRVRESSGSWPPARSGNMKARGMCCCRRSQLVPPTGVISCARTKV